MLSWLYSSLAPATCALWATLSVGVLLADPEGIPARAEAQARAHLEAAEPIARTAMILDAGPSPLRWVLGLRPARDAAPAILGDAMADVERALAAARLERKALTATRYPAPPPPAAGIQGAVAQWVLRALGKGPPAPAPPPEAVRATGHLADAQQAVKRGRLRLVFLAFQVGLVRWSELLALALASRWVFHKPAVVPGPLPQTPLAPPERPSWAFPYLGRLGRDPLVRLLHGAGVPRRLAVGLVDLLTRNPDWPGSLRGHDSAPGGLRRHTIAVLRHTWGLTRAWPPVDRRLALVLAVAHDLGKLLSYRRVGPGRWTGSPATPHDSLSVTLLLGLPEWTRLAPAEARQALLQALFYYHAPDTLPIATPLLARSLMDTLVKADRQAIEDAGDSPEAFNVA